MSTATQPGPAGLTWREEEGGRTAVPKEGTGLGDGEDGVQAGEPRLRRRMGQGPAPHSNWGNESRETLRCPQLIVTLVHLYWRQERGWTETDAKD